MWYAAHVIMYVEFKESAQNTFPVWENVYLVEADSPDGAREKAAQMGQADEGDSNGSFLWDQKPSKWVYGGIRKLIECQYSPDQIVDDELDERPGDGTEVTYSQFIVKNKTDLTRLVAGESVNLLYED